MSVLVGPSAQSSAVGGVQSSLTSSAAVPKVLSYKTETVRNLVRFTVELGERNKMTSAVFRPVNSSTARVRLFFDQFRNHHVSSQAVDARATLRVNTLDEAASKKAFEDWVVATFEKIEAHGGEDFREDDGVRIDEHGWPAQEEDDEQDEQDEEAAGTLNLLSKRRRVI